MPLISLQLEKILDLWTQEDEVIAVERMLTAMQHAGTNDVTERALRALILKVASAKDQRKHVPSDSSFVNNAHFAVAHAVSLLASGSRVFLS